MSVSMNSPAQIILQTKKWITDVVVGCNFCPFAARELKQNTIHYRVEPGTELNICLESFLQECVRLDNDEMIETTLLIFPNAFHSFDDYLDLVGHAEKLIHKKGYEGIYQVATFHPQYRFADSTPDDAANYTNRSIYPMLHLLREESIEQALQRYSDPGQIPERNIRFAREKGTVYMKMLRDTCL
ncbi:MAG TPA: DUF1415 domain-containing protein [Chitinophagaceae bacterium]|nr:DUF1415 domain-containing protein [Chitinophagaceae bacterium]